MTDEELLLIWRKSQGRGLELIYERYAGPLLRYVYRFTGNQEQAEEILQEIFTEFHRLSPTRDFNLKAWLFTVAKNKSLNFERRKKREVPSEDFVLAATGPEDLELQVSEAELLKCLARGEARLPEDLAHTWSLRRQGLDYQEIADHLKIPLGTVKSRFHRLVEYFRKEFKIENQ